MAGQQHKLSAMFDLDMSQAEKRMRDFEARVSRIGVGGAGGNRGGTGGGGGIAAETERATKAAGQLEARYKSLQAIVSKLSADKGQSAELAKVQQELAGIIGQQRKRAQGQENYLKLLREETRLRQQARQNLNNSQGGSGFYSAHSQRQFGQISSVQSLLGQIRGGGLAGSAGGMATAGGLAGAGVAAAALAALAVGATRLVSAFQELAAKARETAKSVSDSGGGYDRTREASRRRQMAEGRLGQNPVFTGLAQAEDWLKEQIAIGLNGIFGGGSGGGGPRALKLLGDDKLGLESLDRNRDNTVRSMGMERAGFERSIFEQRRDFEEQIRAFQLDTARRREDLEIAISQKREDLEMRRQRLAEDFEGRMAAARFALDQERSRREQAFKEADARDDFERRRRFDREAFQAEQADRAQAYGNARGDRQTDFANSQSDAAEDFGIASRNRSQDFGRNQARAAQDYRNRLFDMSMSNASGLSFLQAARDYRLARGREAEDYRTEQARAAEQFGIERSRSGREYGLETARGERDYLIEQSIAGRNFGRGQAQQGEEFAANQFRSRRDFEAAQADALAQRGLEIQAHENELRWAGIELERDMQRATLEASIALRRLAEDTAVGRRALANRAGDMDFAEGMGRERLGLSEQMTRQGLLDADRGFASSLTGKYDPATLQRLAGGNPRIAAMLEEYGRASGIMPDLGGSSGTFKPNYDWNAGVTAGGAAPMPLPAPGGGMAIPAPAAPSIVNLGDLNITGGGLTADQARQLNTDVAEFVNRRLRELEERSSREVQQMFRMYR